MKEGCEMPYSIKNQYDHGCPAAAYKGSMKGLACQLSITENGGGHRALRPLMSYWLLMDSEGEEDIIFT